MPVAWIAVRLDRVYGNRPVAAGNGRPGAAVPPGGRRRWRRVAVVVVAGATVVTPAFGVAVVPLRRNSDVSAVGCVGCYPPLPIPPQASHPRDDGVRVFGLEAHAGTAELRPGRPTPTWGINGGCLGYTLRARSAFGVGRCRRRCPLKAPGGMGAGERGAGGTRAEPE